MVLSADGQTLFSGGGNYGFGERMIIKVWKRKGKTWECRQTLEGGHAGRISSMVLSADEKTLFSAGAGSGGTIRIWGIREKR